VRGIHERSLPPSLDREDVIIGTDENIRRSISSIGKNPDEVTLILAQASNTRGQKRLLGIEGGLSVIDTMALRSPFEIAPHVPHFVGIQQEWPLGHALLSDLSRFGSP
jgi:hypothetical protein